MCFRGCLVSAKEARDGCGIAVCFMGYGKDEMETELERGHTTAVRFVQC